MKLWTTNRESAWINGATEDGYTFMAKAFETPSHYGIPTPRFKKGGNVSKLWIKDPEGRLVYNYDRGFDLIDGDMAEEVANEIVAELEGLCDGSLAFDRLPCDSNQ